MRILTPHLAASHEPGPHTDPPQPAGDGSAAVAELYHPPLAPPHSRTPGLWVRSNCITSLDGSVSGEDGLSGSLGTPADRMVFDLLRATCDVILVGSGTVRAEGYQRASVPEQFSHLRTQSAPPAMAVLSSQSRPPETLQPQATGGGEAFTVDGRKGLAGVMTELADRGYRVVLCEGGPGVWQQMLAADLIDEWCQTIAPRLVGNEHHALPSPVQGEGERGWELASLVEDDSTLLTRWVRTPG